MLLNKIACLDKGYVALLDSSCDSQKLTDIRNEFMMGRDHPHLREYLASMTLAIKCPLFVASTLSQWRLNIVQPTGSSEIEAYIPNPGEISSPDHQTNKIIADDILRTTDALLINPKAYQTDGCDRFVSQIIMPVSTYTTLIVSGSYNQWDRYCSHHKNGPAPVKSYALAIEQIMKAEWN
jgi:hypothetical protein